MSVYGSKGSVPDIPIMTSEENGVLLERGSMDVFPVELDKIGTLKMIKLSHNGKGSRPEWFCDKVSFWSIWTEPTILAMSFPAQFLMQSDLVEAVLECL